MAKRKPKPLPAPKGKRPAVDPVSLPEHPTPAILAVLGRPNYACVWVAKQLREVKGWAVPVDSEGEQGHVLFYLLPWAIRYPDDWHKRILVDLEAGNPDTGPLGRAKK